MQIVSYDTIQYQRLLLLVSTNTVKERDVFVLKEAADSSETSTNCTVSWPARTWPKFLLSQKPQLNFRHIFTICPVLVLRPSCVPQKVHVNQKGFVFSRILHSIDWWPVTDGAGQHISPTFKDQAVQEECQEHLGTQLHREWCRWW
jgi:hypothetical protein